MRNNPFIPIYQATNHGSMPEKLEKIISGEISTPRYLDVELTNSCNFHCLMCPTGTGESKRAKGFMSEEIFEKLEESVRKYHIQGVRFIGWGGTNTTS